MKDPLVYARVWWIMETQKHFACVIGWVAQLCHSWLCLEKMTQISQWDKFLFKARSFKNTTPELWDDLPKSIQEAESTKSFRSCLKTSFIVLTFFASPFSLFYILFLLSTTSMFLLVLKRSECRSYINGQ